MSTPIWSFDESAEIVRRLCWDSPGVVTDRHIVEDRLLEKFNDDITGLFQQDGLNASPIVNLPRGVKERVIRQPYIAGFLSGRLLLSAREILHCVSESLRTTASAMSAEYNKRATDLPRPYLHESMGSSLIIDHENSIVVPTLDDRREWLSNYTEDNFRAIIAEMEAALCNMERVSKSAWTFVNSYIWNLSVRKNTEQPNRFGTYTFPTLPGFLLICNPHSDTVDRFLIEETFLHEAIHCFLDWAEARGPEILRTNEPNTRLVKSPWTGNELNIHTAFHATLVWFGLGEYFKRCTAVGLSNAHKSRFDRRLEFIKKGFRSKDFELFMEHLIAACNEGACNALNIISVKRLE